jgi:predicted nucleotide-binding protein (sugar kinase/HSP70/actin superfamily)
MTIGFYVRSYCSLHAALASPSTAPLALNLFACGLTAVTVNALTTTLVNNTGLMELKLGGNKIGRALKARVSKVLCCWD